MSSLYAELCREGVTCTDGDPLYHTFSVRPSLVPLGTQLRPRELKVAKSLQLFECYMKLADGARKHPESTGSVQSRPSFERGTPPHPGPRAEAPSLSAVTAQTPSQADRPSTRRKYFLTLKFRTNGLPLPPFRAVGVSEASAQSV